MTVNSRPEKPFSAILNQCVQMRQWSKLGRRFPSHMPLFQRYLFRVLQVVSGMFAVYNGPETKGRIDADRKRELNTRQSQEVAVAAQRQNAYTAANSSFIGDQQQQQQAIRQQQDQSLDKMGNALDTLDAMAREIKVELDAQNVMLEDVDREIDTAQTKMDHAMKGIQKLLNTKSNCQIAIIAILVVIFVIVAAIAFS
jgi:hypothetical protein